MFSLQRLEEATVFLQAAQQADISTGKPPIRLLKALANIMPRPWICGLGWRTLFDSWVRMTKRPPQVHAF